MTRNGTWPLRFCHQFLHFREEFPHVFDSGHAVAAAAAAVVAAAAVGAAAAVDSADAVAIRWWFLSSLAMPSPPDCATPARPM